jgi:hypothetical protein
VNFYKIYSVFFWKTAKYLITFYYKIIVFLINVKMKIEKFAVKKVKNILLYRFYYLFIAWVI